MRLSRGLRGGRACAPAWDVTAASVPGAGMVLADGRGFTLYVYMPDHQGPSRCAGVCAEDWPPLVLPAGVRQAVAGKGLEAALLGTVPRPGGVRQVTYDGWPLYLRPGDHVPGQATGQAHDRAVVSPVG